MILLTRDGDVALNAGPALPGSAALAHHRLADGSGAAAGHRLEPAAQLPDEPPVRADTSCAFAALPVNLRFVAKHVLWYVPFLGQDMAMTGMIFINRSRHTEAVKHLVLAGERIRQDANLVAFP